LHDHVGHDGESWGRCPKHSSADDILQGFYVVRRKESKVGSGFGRRIESSSVVSGLGREDTGGSGSRPFVFLVRWCRPFGSHVLLVGTMSDDVNRLGRGVVRVLPKGDVPVG